MAFYQGLATQERVETFVAFG